MSPLAVIILLFVFVMISFVVSFVFHRISIELTMRLDNAVVEYMKLTDKRLEELEK